MYNKMVGEVLLMVVEATPDELKHVYQYLKHEVKDTDKKVMPKLMGASKAAEYLGVSRPTFWRMCNAGVFTRLDIYGDGRTHRYSVEELDAFVGGLTQ